MPRSDTINRGTRTRIFFLVLAGSLLTVLMAPAAGAEEPVRCGTMWYEWVGGSTAVVTDYTEDPGLSITIVGTYLWAQNTDEQASSTQHTTSVELTPDSPNPYTICVGDTTSAPPPAEPSRCGTMWYEWVGTTAVVTDYVEDPGLSITIVGRYLWAQNTAEPASSSEHTASVELTADSPNPYTLCIGDTTNHAPKQSTVTESAPEEPTAVQASVPETQQAGAVPAMQIVQVSETVDEPVLHVAAGARWVMCERYIEELLCAL
ncbi:MAG: hypothetical protein ACR2NG_01380 [Acidimicrobiia bacterium]